MQRNNISYEKKQKKSRKNGTFYIYKSINIIQQKVTPAGKGCVI